MPIRPENKKLYPKNWREIRVKILQECNISCEFCGIKNYKYTAQNKTTRQRYVFDTLREYEDWTCDCEYDYTKPAKIVLTIAHLDQDPTNNERANLRALCQKCHNKLDAPFRQKNRKANKIKDQVAAGQIKMECNYEI